MSCPDCQPKGSGRALWFVLIAFLFVGIVAVAGCASAPPPTPNVNTAPAPESSHGSDHQHHEHSAPGTSASSEPLTAPASTDHDAPGISGEQLAYQRARPVFERFCADCHTTSGSRSRPAQLQHFSMDAYPFSGHHANEIATTIRKVLGVTGAGATMPRDRPGVVQGDDLQLILEWANAADRVQALAPHDEHEHHEH